MEGRNENSADYIKWVGQCNRNEVDLGYLRNPSFNYDEATGYPFRWDGVSAKNFMVFEFKWDDLVPYHYDDDEIASGICSKGYKFPFVRNLSSLTTLNWQLVCGDAWEDGFNFTLPAVRIDTSILKTFYIGSSHALRFHVTYIKNKEGTELTQQDQQDYPAPISFLGRYGISTRGFRNGIEESASIFMVPDDISQVEVAVEGKFDWVKIYSKTSYANVVVPHVKGEGSIEDIPSGGFVGQEYIAEENNQVLVRAKRNWMNPNGTLISKVTII